MTFIESYLNYVKLIFLASDCVDKLNLFYEAIEIESFLFVRAVKRLLGQSIIQQMKTYIYRDSNEGN